MESQRSVQFNQFDLLNNLIENGQDYTKLNKSAPFVPELSVGIPAIITKIIAALVKEDPKGSPTLYFGWSFYAGMGAVMLWHLNWHQLQKSGVFESLVKERGIDEMDEYVHDIVGIPLKSKGGQKLFSHIMESAYVVIAANMEANAGKNDEEKKAIFLSCCEAMYRYGMAVQLTRLGMK